MTFGQLNAAKDNAVLVPTWYAGTFLYAQTLIDSLTFDGNWNCSRYSVDEKIPRGLKRHVGLWAVVGLSTEFSARTLVRSIGPFLNRMIASDLLDDGY